MGSGKEIVVVGNCISEHCARGRDRAGDVGVNAWLELHVFWLRLWSWYQRDCETLKHLLKYNYETLSRVADRGVYISFHFVWIVYNHTLASTMVRIRHCNTLQWRPCCFSKLSKASSSSFVNGSRLCSGLMYSTQRSRHCLELPQVRRLRVA